MRPIPRALLVVPILASTLAATAQAGAPPSRAPRTKRACIDASEDAQRLRKAGQLRAASEALVACGDPACPPIVREACGEWMAEVSEAMPSVVLGARDAEGHDVVDVRVDLDGAHVADSLDGRPLELDPGQHDLVFVRGAETARERLLVREGERARLVMVTFSARAPSTPARAPDTHRPRGGAPITTWILAGVALAALGGAIALDVSAFDEADCKPTCSDDEVSSIKRKTYAAGALVGVSALSLGAAAYFFFTRPSAPRARGTAGSTGAGPRLAVRPWRDGVAASIIGSF